MLGKDLRDSLWPEAINPALTTAAARLCVMITAHDKYYYWLICKSRQQKRLRAVEQADVRPLLKKYKHRAWRKRCVADFSLIWLMTYSDVKLCLPLGEKELSWTGDLHIRKEQLGMQQLIKEERLSTLCMHYRNHGKCKRLTLQGINFFFIFKYWKLSWSLWFVSSNKTGVEKQLD